MNSTSDSKVIQDCSGSLEEIFAVQGHLFLINACREYDPMTSIGLWELHFHWTPTWKLYYIKLYCHDKYLFSLIS